MIGGALLGTKFRFGAIGQNLAGLLQIAVTAGRLRDIQDLAREIGRAAYISVAPRSLFERKQRLNRPRVLPWHVDASLSHSSRALHRDWATINASKTSDLGPSKNGACWPHSELISEPEFKKRFRMPNAQLSLGRKLLISKPALIASASSSSQSVLSYASSKRFIPAGQVKITGSKRAVNSLPCLAPIRAVEKADEILYRTETSRSSQSSLAAPFRGPLGSAEGKTMSARAAIQRERETLPTGSSAESRSSSRVSFRRAIESFFAEQARQPPSGIGGFDPNLSPTWAGLQIPG